MSVIEKLDELEGVRFDVEEGVDGMWRIAGSRSAIIKLGEVLRELPAIRQMLPDSDRLDFIERSFSGMTNCERYLPVRMIWGKGCNGRTLRDACDKYMQRDARLASDSEGPEADSGGEG